MSLKPLGKLKELVESVGMGVSYAYDDLVFLDHNGFLMQFGEDGKTVFIHTNCEADGVEAAVGVARLKKAAASSGITFAEGKFYSLAQVEDQAISIRFHEHC